MYYNLLQSLCGCVLMWNCINIRITPVVMTLQEQVDSLSAAMVLISGFMKCGQVFLFIRNMNARLLLPVMIIRIKDSWLSGYIDPGYHMHA